MSQQQQDQQGPHPQHDHTIPRRHGEFESKQQQAQEQQSPECRLYSLVQYECNLEASSITCRPIFRLLKKCKGRPTVEVTPLYDPAGNVLYG